MRRHLSWLIVTGLLLAGLGFVVWGFFAVWDLSPAELTVHGWIAMALAFLGVGALSGVLMWLAFYSSRAGYDERAGYDDADGPMLRRPAVDDEA